MDIRLTVRLTIVLALGGAVAWMAALLVALPSGSVATTVIIRTVLTLSTLVLLTRILVRRAYDGPGLAPAVVAAAVASGAVFPATWVGRALGAQLLLDPGPVTALLDLVLWVVVVVAAGRSVRPREAPMGYTTYLG
jgi:hypothetical protein